MHDYVVIHDAAMKTHAVLVIVSDASSICNTMVVFAAICFTVRTVRTGCGLQYQLVKVAGVYRGNLRIV